MAETESSAQDHVDASTADPPAPLVTASPQEVAAGVHVIPDRRAGTRGWAQYTGSPNSRATRS